MEKGRISDEDFRRSIRYQRAWEDTDKDFLFIMHNDCLFTSDIIGGMLDILNTQPYVGVGRVGQCWNCPANHAKVCNGDLHESYNPSYSEVVELINMYPSPRTTLDRIDPTSPMPLPECRLNEFGCMINVGRLRHLVSPHGDIPPFGMMALDIGTDWYRALVCRGFRFLNWYEGMQHGWCGGSGHPSDTKEEIYFLFEEKAKQYLQENYNSVISDFDSPSPRFERASTPDREFTPNPLGTNLALGKRATQSSVSPWSRGETPEKDATRVVSGIFTGTYNCHTALEDRPWWRVDLERACRIRQVRIYNRISGPDIMLRTSRFEIQTSDDDENWNLVFRKDTDSVFVGKRDSPFSWTPDQEILARFVRVQLLGRQFLHLEQVEIFGEDEIPAAGSAASS
jgi:hypothetical protein